VHVRSCKQIYSEQQQQDGLGGFGSPSDEEYSLLNSADVIAHDDDECDP